MKVKFIPNNKEYEIEAGESVLELAQRVGVSIYTVCNGMPSCAECRIKIVEGDTNVLPPNRKELDLIGSGHFVDRRRLACQVKCFGDIVVDLEEQIEKSKDREYKRPQGAVKKEQNETSYAVTGNLIDQDEEFDLTKEETGEVLVDVEGRGKRTPRRVKTNEKRREKASLRSHSFKPKQNKEASGKDDSGKKDTGRNKRGKNNSKKSKKGFRFKNSNKNLGQKKSPQ